MSINPIFRNGAFCDEELQRLELAYKCTLRSLRLMDHSNDPLTEMIARRIIQIGATERDPSKIAQLALKQLGLCG